MLPLRELGEGFGYEELCMGIIKRLRYLSLLLGYCGLLFILRGGYVMVLLIIAIIDVHNMGEKEKGTCRCYETGVPGHVIFCNAK
ncbi:hypothetical protein [Cellulosilyticum sp. I15G10I2]|uniref:hypothetical protein n=1 Tax=Cellulosilyticum sp. I15G10I2 TaxID=1892843 RepID=UPI00085C00AD|nr:hypothetical protein [Cellulosilyticum sp. I15G10I2]